MPSNRNHNTYKRLDFFFVADRQFWENQNYTEKAKEYFRAIVERDRQLMERRVKEDQVIWKIKH